LVSVQIRSKAPGALASECEGPLWSRGCSGAAAGEPVACAGRQIVIRSDEGQDIAILAVEPDARSCPLAALQIAFARRPGQGRRTRHR
jgi:hypothetical protein